MYSSGDGTRLSVVAVFPAETLNVKPSDDRVKIPHDRHSETSRKTRPAFLISFAAVDADHIYICIYSRGARVGEVRCKGIVGEIGIATMSAEVCMCATIAGVPALPSRRNLGFERSAMSRMAWRAGTGEDGVFLAEVK